MTTRNNIYAEQPIAIIISAGGSPNAYDLVRSLGMAGVACCVMSSQKDDIAFSSRYCSERVVLPPFENKYYQSILGILKRYASHLPEKPVLFYPSDPELRFVCEHDNELTDHVLFLLPPENILEPLVNKVLFSKFAQREGIPVPGSVVCRSIEEIRSSLDQISFPCIVKPAFTDHWNWETDEQRKRFGPYKKALRRFDSSNELIDFCQALPERPWGFLIQEYIDGRDEEICSFHGYFDEESRCLAWFLGRKIRTYPMHTGGSSYIRTIHNPDLARRSIRLLQQIKYRGIVKIDFKMDGTEETFKVLEINTRYNLWQLLGAYAGVNLAAVAFRSQSGGSSAMSKQYTDDVRLLHVKQDLRALLTDYIGSGEWGALSYIQSLKGKKYYRVWDPRDPLPFFLSMFEFVKRNLARLLKLSRSPKTGKSHERSLGFVICRSERGMYENTFPGESGRDGYGI